jgi:5'-deoxynucleotidase YfbR-like HD superfamily hydrolase
MTVEEVIDLSDLLGQLGHVRRATLLPNGEQESDSHHAFSLALIAYQFCLQHCPDLDINKVILFALSHDLLEVVTGDENTLHYDATAHKRKQQREEKAEREFDELFRRYPALKTALRDYERLDTPEAAAVFVLDKACTTWTHHHDKGASLRQLEVTNRAEVIAWADRVRTKLQLRLKVMPPQTVLDVCEDSFIQLQELYDH